MGKLENLMKEVGNRLKFVEQQIGQIATVVSNQHQTGKFTSNTIANSQKQVNAVFIVDETVMKQRMKFQRRLVKSNLTPYDHYLIQNPIQNC